MLKNNCECCMSSYEPYKTGKDEDIFVGWCELPLPGVEPKGLCGFCNPKSIWYNHNPNHVRESCRNKENADY